LSFYLEYDRGTETTRQLANKLAGYISDPSPGEDGAWCGTRIRMFGKPSVPRSSPWPRRSRTGKRANGFREHSEKEKTQVPDEESAEALVAALPLVKVDRELVGDQEFRNLLAALNFEATYDPRERADPTGSR
jgi:hypothetical protein